MNRQGIVRFALMLIILGMGIVWFILATTGRPRATFEQVDTPVSAGDREPVPTKNIPMH